MQAVWYNMIHQGHATHSLSRKPQVGDVRTNSLRVRVVTEPEALVQLLDLRVRRNLGFLALVCDSFGDTGVRRDQQCMDLKNVAVE